MVYLWLIIMVDVSESIIRWVQIQSYSGGKIAHLGLPSYGSTSVADSEVRESSSAIRYIQTTVMAQLTAINRNITPTTKVIYHEIVPVIITVRALTVQLNNYVAIK